MRHAAGLNFIFVLVFSDLFYVLNHVPYDSRIATFRPQKRALGPLDLGLDMVVSHNEGTGNRTQVPLQEQQVLLVAEPFSQPLSCFSWLFLCAVLMFVPRAHSSEGYLTQWEPQASFSSSLVI